MVLSVSFVSKSDKSNFRFFGSLLKDSLELLPPPPPPPSIEDSVFEGVLLLLFPLVPSGELLLAGEPVVLAVDAFEMFGCFI